MDPFDEIETKFQSESSPLGLIFSPHIPRRLKESSSGILFLSKTLFPSLENFLVPINRVYGKFYIYELMRNGPMKEFLKLETSFSKIT